MGNSRIRNRFELALDGKQVVALGLGTIVMVAAVFVLGMSLGRRSAVAETPAVPAPTLAATHDPLAHLDEPLPAREEPKVELKAHQALTDARPIDKAMPVPAVKSSPPAPSPAPPAPAAAASAPEPEPAKTASAPPPAPAAPPTAAAKPTKPKAAKTAKIARAPAPAPAKAAPAAHKGAYAIQVASLQKRADAERIAHRHSARHPRIVQAEVPGKGRYYRVLLGAFDTPDAAKRALAALTRSGVQGIVTAVR